jgi:hypothetical protein
MSTHENLIGTILGSYRLARLLNSSPGEGPPASTSQSAAMSASPPAAQKTTSRPVTTAPDVGVIRQLTLRLEVTPPSARVLLDGRQLEQREVQLPADGRERRLTVTAEGYRLNEQSFKADGDRTLRIELTRDWPTRGLRVGAPPLAKGSPAHRRPAPKAARKKPARKKPARKKPYFNEL